MYALHKSNETNFYKRVYDMYRQELAWDEGKI